MRAARRLLRSPVLLCAVLSGVGAVVYTKTNPAYRDKDYDGRLDALFGSLAIFVPSGLAIGVVLKFTNKAFRRRRST